MDGLLAQQLADVRQALELAGRLIGSSVSSPPTDIQADPDAAKAWLPEAGGGSSVKVDGDALHAAGQNHQYAADYFQAHNERTGPPIEQFLGSLGPVFGDFRAAGLEVLDHRRADYEAQASGHADMTSGLTTVMTTWQGHEQQAAQQMRGVADA